MVEHTGDPKKEFKAAVEHHGLTGLIFRPVWDSETGIIVPDRQRRRRSWINPKNNRRCANSPTDDVNEEIASCLSDGLKLLKIGGDFKPDRMQEAVNSWIDDFRAKKKRPKADLMDTAMALGCVWGESICDNSAGNGRL